jgi:hypothetical protein
MFHAAGIVPLLCLITEIGRNGRFLDIYRYASLKDYEERTERLLNNEGMAQYYSEVERCIYGGILVELAFQFPHIQTAAA